MKHKAITVKQEFSAFNTNVKQNPCSNPSKQEIIVDYKQDFGLRIKFVYSSVFCSASFIVSCCFWETLKCCQSVVFYAVFVLLIYICSKVSVENKLIM